MGVNENIYRFAHMFCKFCTKCNSRKKKAYLSFTQLVKGSFCILLLSSTRLIPCRPTYLMYMNSCLSLGLLSWRFLEFKSLFLQAEYSFVHYFFITEVNRDAFWSRIEENEGKSTLIVRHYRCHFELYWSFHVLRQKCLPLSHPPDIWTDNNSTTLGIKPNLVREVGENAFNPRLMHK